MEPKARKVSRYRVTNETEIELRLDLDGSGKSDIDTGIPFYDHMLTAFAMHGRVDLELKVSGDLEVSQHHTVEDVGIVLGGAIAEAVGTKAGIFRYGHAYVPMDEALARVSLDLSGRAYAVVEIPWSPMLGPTGIDYQLTTEFFWAVARGAAMTVHVDGLRGRSNHHLCEAAFKAFGQALRAAVEFDSRLGGSLPSTKGSFDG